MPVTVTRGALNTKTGEWGAQGYVSIIFKLGVPFTATGDLRQNQFSFKALRMHFGDHQPKACEP